jgi:hypothetical protein
LAGSFATTYTCGTGESFNSSITFKDIYKDPTAEFISAPFNGTAACNATHPVAIDEGEADEVMDDCAAVVFDAPSCGGSGIFSDNLTFFASSNSINLTPASYCSLNISLTQQVTTYDFTTRTTARPRVVYPQECPAGCLLFRQVVCPAGCPAGCRQYCLVAYPAAEGCLLIILPRLVAYGNAMCTQSVDCCALNGANYTKIQKKILRGG